MKERERKEMEYLAGVRMQPLDGIAYLLAPLGEPLFVHEKRS